MKPPTINPIGARIRELRLAKGQRLYDALAKKVPADALKPAEDQYTQLDLANDSGCRPDQISSWECGRKVPSLGSLAKLARVMGVKLAELVDQE